MFFGPTLVDPALFPIEYPRTWYNLNHEEFGTLRLDFWLYEHVLDAYMQLLRDREEKYRQAEIYRWTRFAFMGSLFMLLRKNCVPPSEQSRVANFCTSYIEPIMGPLHECDYIFLPLCVPGNRHFILLLFAVRDWKINIIDLLYNDTPYIYEVDKDVQGIHSSSGACNI